MTEKVRLRLQKAETSFLSRLDWLRLRDKVSSPRVQKEHRVGGGFSGFPPVGPSRPALDMVGVKSGGGSLPTLLQSASTTHSSGEKWMEERLRHLTGTLICCQFPLMVCL